MTIKVVTTDEDLEKAYHIRTIVFVDEQKVPAALEIDEYEDSAIHFLCKQGNIPIGASRLRFVDGAGKLERICILPSYRGQGHSKQLIQTMENKMIEQGINEAVLHAQVHVVPLYASVGYEVTSEEFMDANIPHVEMRKKL